MALAVLALSLASCGTKSTGCRTGFEADPPGICAIERVEFSREAIVGDDGGRLSCTAWLDAETLLGVGDGMLLVEIHVPSRTVRRRRMSGPRDFSRDVESMAVLDRRHVAFGTSWGSIVVYDPHGARFVGERPLLELQRAVYACAWRSPTEVLGVHVGGPVLAFKLPGLEGIVVEPDAHDYVDFGPGGHILIPWGGGTVERDAVLLDPGGDVVWRRPGRNDPNAAHAVSYIGSASSDGRYAAMGRFDESLHLAQVHPSGGVSWHELRSSRARSTCTAMAFVPGTRALVVAWDSALEVFDAETRESLAWLDLGDVNLTGWPRQILAVSAAGFVALKEPSAAVMIFRIVRGDPASRTR